MAEAPGDPAVGAACGATRTWKHVACDCREGVLVLRGCLPSYCLKQIAQEAVARLEGVAAIDNRLQVVTPAPR
jgi:hypothetical protein